MKPITNQAYRLMHEGAIALAGVEANGIKVDTKYLNNAIKRTTKQIENSSEKIKKSKEFKVWRKRYGQKTNLDSPIQLGEVLFNILKYDCPERTITGKPKTDEAVLETIDIPFINHYLKIKKLKKAKNTYLQGILRETENGFLHPVFNLHFAQTFRSCVAKGTLIEIVRDSTKHPKGIPIEYVKKGDYAYCYDDAKNLKIKKVLWAGKTGTKRVIRLHWSAVGKKGHIDLTPEHKVRVASGKYVEAQNLIGNFRDSHTSKHSPKLQVLALGRTGDRIYITNSKTLLDHRFVYKELKGNLSKDMIIHHIDGNHLNNNPENLQKMTLKKHSKLHECFTDAGRKKAIINRLANYKKYGNKCVKGKEHYYYLDVSKFSLLRILANAKGKSSNTKHDFGTIKKKALELNIDLKIVKDRYANNQYISLGKLKRANKKGRAHLQKELGIGHYHALDILKQRKISTKRKWANQMGAFIPHNHKITKIEWINKTVGVYDLEIEDEHNFIANEICVHNSSSSPNFQNMPIRNYEIGKLIRQSFIPRSSHRHIVEVDYSGIEVHAAAWYHKDPVMLDYINDKTKDMHRDMAQQCYMLPKKEMIAKDKEDAKRIKTIRYCGKNKFVFPQFYGDWFYSVAPSLWQAMEQMKLTTRDGTPMKQWLINQGIKGLGSIDKTKDANGRWNYPKPQPNTFINHIKEVENDFWNKRFKKYKQWKDEWYSAYLDTGKFKMLSGFEVEGFYKRNEVINYPVQGVAFHCLLWSLIRITKLLRKYKMKSLLIGQIHDSLVGDVYKKELKNYLEIVNQVMTVDIRKHWKFIITPLEIEAEVAPLGKSWFEKQEVKN